MDQLQERRLTISIPLPEMQETVCSIFLLSMIHSRCRNYFFLACSLCAPIEVWVDSMHTCTYAETQSVLSHGM